ncbi:hypothetical protein [Blastococcus saxobsidens]|uniref:Uncharacterized protein n=1 Tax=Blastococcus saxobsidens (strain DD2) TaxID=1146883 RepID=H6RS67_BLASD|nr:hypothetical protein [Blastococcus saxobsidens]CCG04261.1 protein of unknown function [Blastococcus saxobsidens DD2]
MSHPDDHGRNDRPEEAGGTPEGRRRGRILIPLVILLVIAAIFAYILLVGLSNDDAAEDIGAPAPAPVVATAAG